MYKKLIESYVNKLTITDIKNFTLNQKISISDKDIDTIFFYIKNYWQIIYEKDPTLIFNDIKTKVEPNTYNIIIEYYNNYKNRI